MFTSVHEKSRGNDFLASYRYADRLCAIFRELYWSKVRLKIRRDSVKRFPSFNSIPVIASDRVKYGVTRRKTDLVQESIYTNLEEGIQVSIS